MQKIDNKDLRINAKNKLTGNYGQGIIAAVVPIFIALLLSLLLNNLTFGTAIGAEVLGVVTSSIQIFMILTMTLRLARNHKSVNFSSSMAPGKNLLTMGIYLFFLTLFILLLQIPINLLMFGEIYVTADYITNALTNINQDDPLILFGFIYSYYLMIVSTNILAFLLLIRFHYTKYIIVDEGLSVLKAMKKSLVLTKGNILRILGMELSFFGWFFLTGLTFGLLYFYVGPYYQVSHMNLYLAIKEEHGEDIGILQVDTDSSITSIETPTSDWMDTSLEENENDSSQWDF